MKSIHCGNCRHTVNNDEIALSFKLLGKQVSYVLCYECLSNTLSCEQGDLLERTEFFKSMGCELFKIDYTGQKERVEK